MRVAHPTLLFCSLLLGVGCGGRSTLDDFASAVPGRPDLGGGGGSGNGGTNSGDGGANGDGGNLEPTGAGEACQSNSDCDDGLQCTSGLEIAGQRIELPGGYCTVPGCASNDDCGAGAQCISVLGDSLCVLECDDDEDCRVDEGYACTTLALADNSDDTFCLPDEEEPIEINPLCGFLCQEEADQIECSRAFADGGGGFGGLPEGCGFGGGGGDNPFGGGGDNPFGGGGGGDDDIDPTCRILCDDEGDLQRCSRILAAGGGLSDLPDSCGG